MSTHILAIDLTPVAPALDGKNLLELIDLFVADHRHNRSPKTARGYEQKLRYFTEWWQRTHSSYDNLLTEAALTDFAVHLETIVSRRGKPLSWHTRNDVLRRLSQMFTWSHRRGYIAVNFAEFVPSARGAQPLRKPLDLSVLRRLFDAASQNKHAQRNCAILAVLAGTGIRCEECSALLVENITVYADGSGYIKLDVTKNDKPRIVAFDTETGNHLRNWLDRLDNQSGPVFPSRKGKNALTASGIYKMIRTLAETAGVRDSIRGAHDLRRLFATVWTRTLRGEGYGQLLQKQLGHASYAMTAQYALQDVEDVLEVMRDRQVTPVSLIMNGKAH